MITAVCPNNPDHKRFSTTARVLEEWQVDEHGNFLASLGCLETVHGPNPGNLWYCCECEDATEAVVTSRNGVVNDAGEGGK